MCQELDQFKRGVDGLVRGLVIGSAKAELEHKGGIEPVPDVQLHAAAVILDEELAVGVVLKIKRGPCELKAQVEAFVVFDGLRPHSGAEDCAQ